MSSDNPIIYLEVRNSIDSAAPNYFWSGDYHTRLMTGHVLKLLYRADRVWLEQNGKVQFIKNRYHHPQSSVDMEEFFIVKLKSTKI